MKYQGIQLKNKDVTISLTEQTVEVIVREWYLNGMITSILQDESGYDLEELLTSEESLQFKIKTKGL